MSNSINCTKFSNNYGWMDGWMDGSLFMYRVHETLLNAWCFLEYHFKNLSPCSVPDRRFFSTLKSSKSLACFGQNGPKGPDDSCIN